MCVNSAAQYIITHGPVPARGPGVEDRCSKVLLFKLKVNLPGASYGSILQRLALASSLFFTPNRRVRIGHAYKTSHLNQISLLCRAAATADKATTNVAGCNHSGNILGEAPRSAGRSWYLLQS